MVRDFALQLVDTEGVKMQAREYLERALEELKGSSDTTHQKNKTRRQFKEFFRQRDCVTMVRPVEQESHLQSLSEMEDSQFRKAFLV